MSEPAKERKPMSQKKKIILFVALGMAVVLIAPILLLRACGYSKEDPLEPILDTSYCIYYHMYTNSSGHGSDTPSYCVTDDGYFILPYMETPLRAKLSPTELDADAFYALFDGQASIPGYWQGEIDGVEFGPEYIYNRLVRAWYCKDNRESSTAFVYIFELNNGMWLVASGGDWDGVPVIADVDEVRSLGSQDVFFDYWQERLTRKSYDWEFLFLKYG